MDFSNMTFDSNSAGYANDTGLIWTTLEVQSISGSSLHVRDSFDFVLKFYDAFGQPAFADSCSITLQLDTDPSGIFDLQQYVWSTADQISFVLSVPLTFDSGLQKPPGPNFSVAANVSMSMETLGSIPDIFQYSIKSCELGQILKASSSKAYGRYECVDCYHGTYADYSTTATLAQCVECPAGFFSESRAWKCEPCKPGNYSSAPGLWECTQCGLGSYSDQWNSTQCFRCEANTFSNESGLSTCQNCPFNSVNYRNGSWSIYECVCPENSFGQPWKNVTRCRACTASSGVSCRFNNSVPSCLMGYYRDPHDYSNIQECIPKSACQQIDQNLTNVCTDGYTGNRCGECLSKKFYRFSDVCVPCPNWIYSYFSSIAVCVLLLSWITIKITRPQSPSRWDLKIVILWFQTVAVFARLPTYWPKKISFLLMYLSAFNINLDLFAPSCAAPLDYWTLYTMQVLLPVILPALLLLICCCVMLVKYLRDREYLAQLKQRLSPHPFEKALAMYIFLISSMYTYLLSVVLSPFRCYPQIDGSYTLIPKPTENCFDANWMKRAPLIAFGILQIIVIPGLILTIYFQRKKHSLSNYFEWRYGLLFRPYRENFFYWELVIILRKTALVMMVDVSNGMQSALRIFLIMIFLVIVFAIEGVCQPLIAKGISILASISWHMFAMFMLLCGALVFDDSKGVESDQVHAIEGLLLLWFFMSLILSGLHAVHTFKKHMKSEKEGMPVLDKAKGISGWFKSTTTTGDVENVQLTSNPISTKFDVEVRMK
eukprot:TRINITY_DN8527_c0_g1_i2.p1 TRINITY_DN8527_c0_g1~~TRINITY_DN8527_c0_g1_i2.p1  ORF type:complete len:791 (-),score=112.92 TRINITY_DN8527_c0_g1_i2:55-2364(-)